MSIRPAALASLVVGALAISGCGDGTADGSATGPDLTSAETSDDSTDEGASATEDSGDGDSGDGDSGDGDGTSGDGDGTSGDGDGTSGDGDGDGTSGDGDGTSGDGDGTSGDGDGTAGDGDGDGACFELTADLSVTPPNVLFVLDKSGSMTMTWNDGGQTKRRWESLRAVVGDLAASLDTHVAFGAKTYPWIMSGFGDCMVDPGAEVPLALNNGATLLSTLPGDLASLQGSTPTQDGIREAIAYLDGVYAGDPSGTPPQAMILVADGSVSCGGSPGPTEAMIAAAFGQSPNSISTYVVGIDISAFNEDEMNAYAVAGGHPLGGATDFYQAADGDALRLAIEGIVSTIQQCVIDLLPEPPATTTFNVSVDGAPVAESPDCATSDGYVVDFTTSPPQMTFCGATCDAVKLAGTANIEYVCIAG